MKKRLPSFSAETAPEGGTAFSEKRANPGAGLGLAVVLAVIFWTTVIAFVL